MFLDLPRFHIALQSFLSAILWSTHQMHPDGTLHWWAALWNPRELGAPRTDGALGLFGLVAQPAIILQACNRQDFFEHSCNIYIVLVCVYFLYTYLLRIYIYDILLGLGPWLSFVDCRDWDWKQRLCSLFSRGVTVTSLQVCCRKLLYCICRISPFSHTEVSLPSHSCSQWCCCGCCCCCRRWCWRCCCFFFAFPLLLLHPPVLWWY